MTTKRAVVAKWTVRKRKNGTRYWYGQCAGDRDSVELQDGEPIICNPDHFAPGTVIVCREPQPQRSEHEQEAGRRA